MHTPGQEITLPTTCRTTRLAAVLVCTFRGLIAPTLCMEGNAFCKTRIVCVCGLSTTPHYPTPPKKKYNIYNVEPLILIKYFLVVCVCVWVGAPPQKNQQKKGEKVHLM